MRKYFELCWTAWAGPPEEAVIVDRARSFLGDFADYLEENGVRLDSAALASPWHVGKVERHDGVWKSMFKRVVQDKQLAGKDAVRTAMTECNRAKNTMARRSGFSPYLWVLGRDIRLPASLCDDAEVERIGEMVAAATPASRFARRVEIRTACRLAFIKADTEDRLRRAEIRQIRPTRGPFVVGQWVLFCDQQNPAHRRPEDPHNWRGLARVIGHEGKHGVWLAFRGLTVLASPEHLAAASDREVGAWRAVTQEEEITHDTPVRGGSGFIDLRGRPTPEAPGAQAEEVEEDDEIPVQTDLGEEPWHTPPGSPPNEAAEQPVPATPIAEEMAWEPEVHDYHGEAASGPAPIDENLEGAERRDRAERESKRRRLLDDVPTSFRPPTGASSSSAAAEPEMASYARQAFERDKSYYTAEQVDQDGLRSAPSSITLSPRWERPKQRQKEKER